MRKLTVTLATLFLSGTLSAATITVRALKINVDDMDKAVAFYRDKLGFQIADGPRNGQRIVTGLDDQVEVVLNKVKKLRIAKEDETMLSFTLQVNDLDEAIARMKANGVWVAPERRTEGVGQAIFIRDPFGRRISLMHQTIRKVEPFKEPRLYNFGYRIPDMNAARDFYSGRLGFVALTERYLPRDLPLGEAGGKFAFMLHVRPDINPVTDRDGSPFNSVVYQTSDLDEAEKTLRAAGAKILNRRPSLVFADPFGNVSEIVESRP